MDKYGYDKKHKELQLLLRNLEDVCDRAAKHNLFSEWHRELLKKTKEVADELNEIARLEGKPTVNIDFSQYIFKPSELSIDDLVKSYEEYQIAKQDYDEKTLPEYFELMKKYNDGEISEEEYKIAANHILEHYKALYKNRLTLTENIRTATVEDYQKRPKDEVDKFLFDLSEYNKKLKEYEHKYKEWNKLKPEEKNTNSEQYKELESLYNELSAKKPDLVKRRGLIYNPKTLKDLKIQKNMLEEIIQDSTKTNDKDFEQNRDKYESKLTEIDELIKNIENFKKAITIKKVKPLEPIKTPGKGGNRKKPKNPRETDEEIYKDYDFDAIAEPSFLEPRVAPKAQNNYYNLEEIIAKILYGSPPDNQIHYKKIDNFIYMNKDIKIINFPKSHGVTILDKPMKLIKTGISAVIRGIGKLCAKVANLNKKRHDTIDGLLKRIDELKPEEIEFLATNFTANRMTELSKAIPEVAMSALNNKIAQYFSAKLDTVNNKIYEIYNEIIKNFNRYTEILNLLDNGNLSPNKTAALQQEMKQLDKNLCQDIIALDDQKKFASDLNKGGAMSFIENWKVRHNSSLGGRNISKKFEEEAIKPYNYTKIAENVRNGNGYLAAKDFLYGEKVKIEGTKTSHKMKNWFHKTRVGAYEFKPFVEMVDYSTDTYWQDVLSTIAIAASIQNMMYVNQLKSELALAQQKITMLDQTIAAQQQEIDLLTQQINAYNQYIAQFNQQIQANNIAIQDLKQICTLYSSDPAKFVDKMTEFAMIENGKVHAMTEYAMQHTDSGRLGTTGLSANGAFYQAYDTQGHLFSKDIYEKIINISNNQAITAEQKATQIANILSGVNQNLATTVAAGKADILKGLALPASGQWSFDAFSYTINNIATYDATFVPSVFNSFINAAIKTNSLQTINNVLPVTVTNITQLQQLAITLPTVQLLPAIVALSTLVGKETVLAIAESYNDSPKKQTDGGWKEKTNELAEKIKDVEIDLEKEARRIFDEREAEWKKKGPIYRLTHKKEKPTIEQAYAEAMKNSETGRSL